MSLCVCGLHVCICAQIFLTSNQATGSKRPKSTDKTTFLQRLKHAEGSAGPRGGGASCLQQSLCQLADGSQNLTWVSMYPYRKCLGSGYYRRRVLDRYVRGAFGVRFRNQSEVVQLQCWRLPRLRVLPQPPTSDVPLRIVPAIAFNPPGCP